VLVTTFPRSSNATQSETDGQETAPIPTDIARGTAGSFSTGADQANRGSADAEEATTTSENATTAAANNAVRRHRYSAIPG
jgi:hypothetical protein